MNAWPAGRRWLWAALAVVAVFCAGPRFLSYLRPPRDLCIDFFQEWASARNLFDGVSPYTENRVTIERHLGLRRGEVVWPNYVELEFNAHPPSAVLLALPVARLDYPDAVFIWNLVSLATLAGTLYLVGRALRLKFTGWSVPPLIVLLLLCHPLREQLFQGQLNLVLLPLITGAWLADRSGRPRLAGALLGTATAIKLFPAFLFIYFVLRRQWAAVTAGGIALALLTAFTAAVLGPRTYLDYIQNVLPTLDRFRSFGFNASLTGLWSKLFEPGVDHIDVLYASPGLARVGTIVSCAGLLGVLMWALRRARSRPELDLAFGLAVTTMVLISPIVWPHYFLLLLVPIAVVWIQLPPSTTLRAVFLLLMIMFWFHPMQVWLALFPEGFTRRDASPIHALTLLSIHTYALLGFFTLGTVLLTGAGHRTTDEMHTSERPQPKGAPENTSCLGIR